MFPVDWPAPSNVVAYQTVRQGGVSGDPFGSFNLAEHVGDDLGLVAENRRRLEQDCGLTSMEIRWLEQVHSSDVVDFNNAHRPADGCFSSERRQACVVMTADCLPVLLCDRSGTAVAAIHCGWRGLASGILGVAVKKFQHGGDLMAWLGPAIGPDHFEVGDEVRQAFLQVHPENHLCFSHVDDEESKKWMADIYALAQMQLRRLGVMAIFGGGDCTFCNSDHYYSYRRDHKTGRQASLIWIQ